MNFSTLPPTDFGQLVQGIEGPAEKLEMIDLMKLDLSSALKNLTEMEKEISVDAQPKTLEDAKEVEKNLETALAEVKNLVKELK